jgi:hypothetical protein
MNINSVAYQNQKEEIIKNVKIIRRYIVSRKEHEIIFVFTKNGINLKSRVYYYREHKLTRINFLAWCRSDFADKVIHGDLNQSELVF